MTKLYIMIILLFSFSTQASVVVGVIDTYVDLPEKYSKNLVENTTINFANQGILNTIISSTEKTTNRITSHGSHVSSTIIGDFSFKQNNQQYLIKNDNVKILSLNYYEPQSSGLINFNNSLKALKYAIDHNVDIINYSGGGPEGSIEELSLFKEAEKKGILVIVAAGNDGNNIDKENKYYPASYNLSNIISVGAFKIDKDSHIIPALFSNFGNKTVSLFAPASFYGYYDKNTIKEMTGTSQATSVVTNLAVALKTKYPHLSALDLKKFILSGVQVLPQLKDYCQSQGIISFENTFRLIEETNKNVVSHIAKDGL